MINYSLSENPGPTGHYKVQSNGGLLVLTVKNGCDPSRLKLVGSLTDKLHNQGVSVLPFIKTKSGEFFAHYQGFWGTLVRFVDGRHAENTISDVKKIATLLSETHLGLQRFPLSRMAKKLTSQLNHEFELSLKHIREDKPMEDCFCSFRDLISDAAKKCDIRYSNHRDAQMLHGDLSPGNIIFDMNNESYLIDFEDSVYSYRPKIHDYGMAALRFALCGGLGPDGSTPHERVVCFSENYFRHDLDCSTNLSQDMLQVAANMVINLSRIHYFNRMFIVGEWNKASTVFNIASDYHRP